MSGVYSPARIASVSRRLAWPLAWSAPALTAICIGLWVVLAAAINTGQFADNIEEFVWAQSFEAGYWKHPPLPSWLLRATIQAFGFWSGWTYVLAALCFIGTAFFVWRVALRLGGQRVAAIAVLLQGLHLGFSWRAQEYNHNTVLVLFSAMTVWAVMRALETKRWRDWFLAGLCAGLAVLAKYQALVMIVGVLIALGLMGALKDKRTRQGCVLAVLGTLLVLLPHIVYLLQGHTTSITYAMQNLQEVRWMTALRRVIAYLVNQLRFHSPMLLAIGLVVLTGRSAFRSSDPSPTDQPPAAVLADHEVRAWLAGLVAWPIGFMAIMALAGGMKLQAQWGLPAFEFLVIFIALRLVRGLPRLRVRALAQAVVIVHVFNAVLFSWLTLGKAPTGSRVDRAYPSRALSEAVLRDWQSATACPLQFVVGPSFEAGIVSVYSGSYPQVLEDGDRAKSPWVDPERIRRAGSVVVRYETHEEASATSIWVPLRGKDSTHHVSWSIVPPEMECETTARTTHASPRNDSQ